MTSNNFAPWYWKNYEICKQWQAYYQQHTYNVAKAFEVAAECQNNVRHRLKAYQEMDASINAAVYFNRNRNNVRDLNQSLPNKDQGIEISDSGLELEVSEEWVNFLLKNRKMNKGNSTRKVSLKAFKNAKKRGQKGKIVCGSDTRVDKEAYLTSTRSEPHAIASYKPNVENLKALYGENYKVVHELETAVSLNWNRFVSHNQPSLWPVSHI